MRNNSNNCFVFKTKGILSGKYYFILSVLFLSLFFLVNTSNSQIVFLSKQVFNYTGSDQVLTIPSCASQIKIKIWGAGGGGSLYNSQNAGGGAGGYVEGRLTVNPGDVFTVMVGEGGACDGTADAVSYGFGGSYSSMNYGGFGGGLSGMFTGTGAVTQTDQLRGLLIAGGGGGGERDAPSTYCTSGGQGGDATFGGGMPDMHGENGGFKTGAGGGGGYNGGLMTLRLSGNGTYHAGEGGTNFIHSSVTAGVSLSSSDFGNWNTFPATHKDPPGVADPDYTAWVSSASPGIGTGNMFTYTKAGHGRVVIEFYADSLTPTVSITPNPIVICQGTSVLFTAIPVNAGTNPNYQWQVNGINVPGATGLTFAGNTLNHADVIGIVVSSACNDSAISTDTIIVHPNPVSDFNNTSVCNGNPTLFSDSSNTASGSLSTWLWDFDDTSPLINTSSPSHPYSNAGNYNVTLIVNNNFGCADTITKSVQVYYKPLAAFTHEDVCLNQTMNFTDSSMVGSGTISSWLWNFADSSPSGSTQNEVHTYSGSGSYLVSLIATTNNGCKDTITKSVVVHSLPAAQFAATNMCDGNVVPFNSISTIAAPDVIQFYVWNFGDGSPVNTNHTTTHLYAAVGSHSVQLLTVSNFGCRDSVTKISIINPNPVVKFSANDTVGCSPLCISFSDSSSIITGASVTHWTWALGDGSPVATSQNFEHCYINTSVNTVAQFTISLTVTSDSGCVTTGSKNNYITVYPNPKADFAAQPGTATYTDPLISIVNLSSGATLWNWDFGDSDTSSVFAPAPHTYADTGSYIITLIAATPYGCKDTAFQTITIEPDFIFYIPNAFTPDGDGLNDSFTGKGIFIKEFEMEIFDRWGNLIFVTDDIKVPWDGKANHGNEIAQRDVYIFVVKVTDFKNRKHNYKGIVTLVR